MLNLLTTLRNDNILRNKVGNDCMMQAVYSRYYARSRELIKKGGKSAVKTFFSLHREVKKYGKYAAAYAEERFILQETFLELKIRSL